jgi:hypothetical protein
VSTPPPVEEEPVAPKLKEEDFSSVPAYSTQEKEPTLFFSAEDNDSDMEWPEWLKSLGAETLESESEPEAAPVPPEMEQSSDFQSWSQQLDQTLSEAEKEQVTTLEFLENDLRAQGFTPLQSGALSTFAEEPSLPSAFTELGSPTSQETASEPPDVETQPLTHKSPVESPASTEYPSALTILAGNAQSSEPGITREDSPDQSSDIAPALDSEQLTEQPTTVSNVVEQAAPQEVSSHVEATSPVVEPAANPAANVSQQSPLTPDFGADAFLENELETTMKRPAVRLPSKQPPDTSYLQGRGNTGERSKVQSENISNKERLLRGYQFQLAGAYDDAMQEYRGIIRNAPDLLSEVISNVRALLKLTPRYSAGYRVLGDAYMRQGEYLQAMEAYNKALTIAKKARSHSS